MAEVEIVVSQATDATGVFRVIAIVEDTQTAFDPVRERTWGTVVRTRLENTSSKKGTAYWQFASGEWQTSIVLPGENQEMNISPARRTYLHLWGGSASWG